MLKEIALKIARIQFLIGAAAALVWLLAGGVAAALAALVGLGISVLMTGYVALKWSLSSDPRQPQAMLSGIYRAEIMKLLLGTGMIFIGVYVFRDQAAALVTTLALTLSAYGFVLLGKID